MKLRYWIIEALKATGFFVIMGLMFVLMMEWGFGGTWEQGATSLCRIGAIGCVLLSTSVYQTHLSLVISFGSTRKEAWFGVQCYRLVIACIILAFAELLLFVTGTVERETVLIGATTFLVCNGLSAFEGGLSTKLRKGALLAASLVAMLLCGGIIMVVLIIAAKHLPQGSIIWIALTVGALINALGMLYEYKTIQNFCVK